LNAIADRFLEALLRTFGDNVAGVFTYGAALFPPSPVTDFDAHVLLHRPLDEAERTSWRALHDGLPDLDLDVWYITLDDAKRSELPLHRGNLEIRDEAWALHRAHVHAGRYVTLYGIDPIEIVPVPTWEELDEALQSELDDALRSSYGEYSILNLCRIYCSYANHNVVFSKLQGALFALAALPDEHHATIRAALDGYRRGEFKKIDAQPFREAMVPLIERERAS
jgi:hypothetical protein